MIEPSAELQSAFDASIFGRDLVKPFPIGDLHRETIHVMRAWQEKFHPEVKRRMPKKRRRK